MFGINEFQPVLGLEDLRLALPLAIRLIITLAVFPFNVVFTAACDDTSSIRQLIGQKDCPFPTGSDIVLPSERLVQADLSSITEQGKHQELNSLNRHATE